MDEIKPDGRSATSAANGKLGGRPKLESSKLREELVRLAEENATELGEAWIKKAKSGDAQALDKLHDRVNGKVTDHVKLEADVHITMDV